MAQRPSLLTLTIWLREALGETSPCTVAVARNPKSGCTSTTDNLTGPSPKICSTKAPLNLMLACIKTAAADI